MQSCSHDGPPNARYDWNIPSLLTLFAVVPATEFEHGCSTSKEQLWKPIWSFLICCSIDRYLGHTFGLETASKSAWKSNTIVMSEKRISNKLCIAQMIHRSSTVIRLVDPVIASRAWNLTEPTSSRSNQTTPLFKWEFFQLALILHLRTPYIGCYQRSLLSCLFKPAAFCTIGEMLSCLQNFVSSIALPTILSCTSWVPAYRIAFLFFQMLLN